MSSPTLVSLTAELLSVLTATQLTILAVNASITTFSSELAANCFAISPTVSSASAMLSINVLSVPLDLDLSSAVMLPPVSPAMLSTVPVASKTTSVECAMLVFRTISALVPFVRLKIAPFAHKIMCVLPALKATVSSPAILDSTISASSARIPARPATALEIASPVIVPTTQLLQVEIASSVPIPAAQVALAHQTTPVQPAFLATQ